MRSRSIRAPALAVREVEHFMCQAHEVDTKVSQNGGPLFAWYKCEVGRIKRPYSNTGSQNSQVTEQTIGGVGWGSPVTQAWSCKAYGLAAFLEWSSDGVRRKVPFQIPNGCVYLSLGI